MIGENGGMRGARGAKRRSAAVLLAVGLVAGLLTTAAVAGAGRASADDAAWPEICVPQTPVPLANPAQPFNTYSVPWTPGHTSNGTTVAQSPAPGSQIVDPATGQPGTWLDAQPYGDGVELDTWQWPAAGSYVSPFDNAHGTGTTTSSNGTITINDGSPTTPGYPAGITTPLLYPPGSTAGTPGTVEPFTSPDLQATVPGSPGNPSVTFATMPLRMNVLLPPGYADHPDASYPVLYLLGGSVSDTGFSGLWMGQGETNGVGLGPSIERDLWTASRDGHPMIVVMPDDSYSGKNMNWYGLDSQQAPTADGSPQNNPDDAPGFEPAPQWQSFFLDQVIPFVDSSYRTEATAAGRFVGGISAGGNAAMTYVGTVDAGQHSASGPYQDLGFGAAGSLSGALDWLTPGLDGDYPSFFAAGEGYWSGSNSGTVPKASATLDGPDPECSQGSGSTTSPAPPATPNPSEITDVWQPDDPVFQAKAWPDSQTRMFLISGEGNPLNIFDLGQWVEYYVGTMTENFAAALAGSPSPQNIWARSWSQYNTGFLDNSGGTPSGQTISATGAVNDCPFRPGHNCVNLYTGGTHSPAYWVPGMASFFRWLEPQANVAVGSG
jgi:S-formylglutathione hydrolase FrmB